MNPAVFDIAPIKWAAENHRLSLAPTLRWGRQPPPSLWCWCFNKQHPAFGNPYQLPQNSLFFCNWIISTDLGFGFLNIHTDKLCRRTERSLDFNEETWTYRETWGQNQAGGYAEFNEEHTGKLEACSLIWRHKSTPPVLIQSRFHVRREHERIKFGIGPHLHLRPLCWCTL